MAKLEVSLAPESLGHIGPVEVTNAMFSTFTVTFLLIILAIIVRKKLNLIPGRLQLIIEMLVNLILDKMTMVFGSEEKARKMFPLIFSIFIFLIFTNYFTLIPFIESIVTEDGVHLFHKPSSHYSLTISLALIMIVTSHVLAILISPIKWAGNFIKIGPLLKSRSPKDIGIAFIELFLGIIETIGEIAKLISLSTRLFGNMLAGGIIIAIISALSFYTQFLAPLPFLALELLTGIVQAFVFTILGILFIGRMSKAVEVNSHH